MKRQIVFDTETTGLKPEDGHRIVEIGAVELIDGKRTGRTYYTLLNPERHIPEEVVKVHQIDDAKVRNAPLFKHVADEFLAFIKDSELLIHNADFDIKFVNSELDRINKGKIWDYVKNATCTLKLSKRLFEEERSHSLDAMCKRFNIDLSQREEQGHGALLDCQLLADCYIEINNRHSAEDIEADLEQTNWVRPEVKRFNGLKLKKASISKKEELEHESFLSKLAEKENVTPVFNKSVSPSRPSI
jgi:DNA polymerase III subunit epsilon